jgi:hypothetical protein
MIELFRWNHQQSLLMLILHKNKKKNFEFFRNMHFSIIVLGKCIIIMCHSRQGFLLYQWTQYGKNRNLFCEHVEQSVVCVTSVARMSENISVKAWTRWLNNHKLWDVDFVVVWVCVSNVRSPIIFMKTWFHLPFWYNWRLQQQNYLLWYLVKLRDEANSRSSDLSFLVNDANKQAWVEISIRLEKGNISKLCKINNSWIKWKLLKLRIQMKHLKWCCEYFLWVYSSRLRWNKQKWKVHDSRYV